MINLVCVNENGLESGGGVFLFGWLVGLFWFALLCFRDQLTSEEQTCSDGPWYVLFWLPKHYSPQIPGKNVPEIIY